MNTEDNRSPILVAGATGYIGARLIPRLLQAGYRVKALARIPAKIGNRPWSEHPNLEILKSNILDLASLTEACQGCAAAYYLIHSAHQAGREFVCQAAANMALAAETGGVQQIIHLTGIIDDRRNQGESEKAGLEVAEILRSGKVPATILRAAMIIGSGSASFEIIRYVVERLPVIVTPRWVDVPFQPVGVRNALDYLIGCLGNEATLGRTFDIGQDQIVTYRQLMRIFAEEAGLPRRLILALPISSPKLSSLFIQLLTPVPAVLARPLAESLRSRLVCSNSDLRDIIPLELLDCRSSIRLALEKERLQQLESTWTDAGELPPAEWSIPGDPGWAGGTCYDDSRQILIAGSPEEVWRAVAGIGGESGWYYADWLWKLRGFFDHLGGGVGLHRGRRSQTEISPGEVLDFWRAVKVAKPYHLLLVAEMKVPGKATLEFRLEEVSPGKTLVRQTARFLPHGLLGILYWYSVTPFHNFIFDGMLNGFAKVISKPVLQGPEKIVPEGE